MAHIMVVREGKMRCLWKLTSCVFVLTVVCSAVPAHASLPGEIRNLTVVDHFFTTRLSSGERYSQTQDPTQSRLLLLKFSGDIPYDNFKLFVTDFTLKYQNNGQEDRNQCYAIATSSNGSPDDFDDFGIGNFASVTLSAGHHYFGIACGIEQNITEVQILPAGGTAIVRAIGANHGLSVYVTTNQGSSVMGRYVQLVQDAGLTVHGSTELVKDVTGVTIRYTPAGETAARELSQRISSALNVTPTIQAMDLASDHDIVIWIGH